jgi:hypothetical protein
LTSSSRSRSPSTGGSLQDRDGKAQLQAHLEYPARGLELFLGRLVVAGGDHVDRQPAQCPAQQLGGVFLDSDYMAKVVEVVEGAVLPLPAVAVLLDTTDKYPCV